MGRNRSYPVRWVACCLIAVCHLPGVIAQLPEPTWVAAPKPAPADDTAATPKPAPRLRTIIARGAPPTIPPLFPRPHTDPATQFLPPVSLPPDDTPGVSRAELPPIVLVNATAPVVPIAAEPPIARLPDAPRELPPLADLPPAVPVPMPKPTVAVPTVPVAPLPPPSPLPGPIAVDGVPLPFDSLAHLIDGNTCGPASIGGCSACGDAPCRAGGNRCEPFPARTAAGRFVGLVYETVCCPDPCYRPRWEPITATAFFADAPRPVTQTRFRWDYGERLTFPDRGEYFWARADGNGRGPTPNPPARGVPALDYHELYLDQEIATGMGSVTISTPYRSVNPTPFANSAAGFGDLRITTKSLLFDSELFLFAFQLRTYIPTGQVGKGLGTGHTSLEPGLIAGVRVSPDTYAVAQVQEWIPLGGNTDYMGAALRFNLALNHVWWRPVKDVQLIGTWELSGIGFQDGLFTEPVLGPQKLSGQTALSMGVGGRLFFCDKFDLGAGYAHGITGKYLVQDQLRVEVRYRY